PISTKSSFVFRFCSRALKTSPASAKTPSNVSTTTTSAFAIASKGRQSDDQITFFKSVGTAVLDVVVAHKIYEKARELGIGTE
ncbi:hypothetical protein PT110_09665, partial [Erysipelothrix rhusiopathiae]|nr:hypothetical protein [Erysipelothrix rhusiopathiae]